MNSMKIETKLKSLELHLKYSEHVRKKKSYIIRSTFRGKEQKILFLFWVYVSGGGGNEGYDGVGGEEGHMKGCYYLRKH